jgi:hypothetical protein
MQFTPTRESCSENGEDNFLTEHPKNIIRAGKFQNVPYVMGTLLYESALFLSKLAAMALMSFSNFNYILNYAGK